MYQRQISVSYQRTLHSNRCTKLKKEGTVLLIGDSLARGVGNHLKSQHSMFESLAFNGAKIEDITKKVEELKEAIVR